MDINLLKKIGLLDQEIRIYLVLLRLGSSTATKIALETNIDRATTYRFLNSLIEKGLVSYVIINSIKQFSAAHPKKIIDDLRTTKEEVELILPELEKLMTLQKEETKMELYKGKEGLKTIMKDILREKKEYTFVGEVEKLFEELPIYVEQWLRQVEKLKIRGKIICTEGKSFKVAKTEIYKLISESFISKISTWTYGNKTALFVWSSPPFGILINNSDVTESNNNLFNFLWSIAKSPSKTHLKITRLEN